MEILERCQPAKAYADDDPWVAVPAAGGDMYVMFFARISGVSDPDPAKDKLVVVAKYDRGGYDGSTDGSRGISILTAEKVGQECPWGYLIDKGGPNQAVEATADPSGN